MENEQKPLQFLTITSNAMLALVNERKEHQWRRIEPNPSAPLQALPLPPDAWLLAFAAAAWRVTAAAGVSGATAGNDALGVTGEVAGECGAELGWAAACERKKIVECTVCTRRIDLSVITQYAMLTINDIYDH